MATISSLGSGSGLDLESLVTKLMQAEQAPLTQLVAKEAKLQSKISALGSLKGALSTFQSSAQTLTSAASFLQATANISDSDVATVSADKTAQTGSYSLEVSQLAQSHKLKSATAFSATTDAVGTGKITIQLGSYSSGTFTVNPDKAATTISIDSSKNTLAGVRDAINAAGAGVKASIVNDGTGNRLVLTSSDTGLVNSMKITVTDDDGNNTDTSGLSQLVYDASTGGTANLSEVQTAKNALFTLDGLSITKASNTVTDVISGVTLNLKTKTESAETITIARDTASVTKLVQDFVKAYNTLNSSMKEMGSYTYDSTTKTGTAGVLQGETSLRSVQSQLRSVFNGVLGSGTYTRLSQVGLTFQKDGTLVLDSTKLTTALESNSAAVASLFSSNGVPTDSGVSFTSATDNTQAGNYAINITQLATKGVLNGSAVTVPVTVDSDSDTFKVKIDGVQSGSIALTQKTYATGADLAAEIQTKINGDSSLKSGSVSVTVAWNSTLNRIEISSTKYGSSSTVELTSEDTGVAAKLGLSVGVGTTGLDVAGTIGGNAATGSGQALTASEGYASGLKVSVQGTTTGYRGTISFNRGFAYQLDKMLDSMLSSSGSISARVNGLNASVKTIDSQMERLQTRLTDTEARYRKQFTALDTTIATMKSTSSYLTQQLASLASLSGSSSS